MPFNVNKCHILHVGTRNQNFDYEMNGVIILPLYVWSLPIHVMHTPVQSKHLVRGEKLAETTQNT